MGKNKNLEAKIKSLPAKPGVYLFKDSAGRVIYVGKAANLRSRVSSYFHSKPADLKTAALVSAVSGLEHIETDSEVEALLLESRLIKDYRPKYNSDLKDDKSYPLIAISREPFPKVTITRDRNRDSLYIGPFVSARDLKQAMPVLQRIFKFRTCNLHISPERRRSRRPCLLYYIERCSGPCTGRVSKTNYAGQIRHLKQFLKGGKKKLVSRLALQMREAAGRLDFERATLLRDEMEAVVHVHQLAQLESLRELPIHPDLSQGLKLLKKVLKLKHLPRLIDGIDAAAISGREAVGSAVVFADGEPHKTSYRHYRIKTAHTLDDPAMIGEVVLRRFRAKVRDTGPMPHILLVDGGETQLRAARAALQKAGALDRIDAVISLAKREEKVFRVQGEPILMDRTSPALKILQHVRDEAHRFAQRYHHILRRKKVLGR
jgi:excinuclease ABC subunit C